jgi:hypothetical protein
MQMRFGKYRGIEISEIPTSYLTWVLREVATLDSDLRLAIEERLGLPASGPAPGRRHRKATAEVLRAWLRGAYHRTSARFHPDHGGTNDQMIAVNAVFEDLRESMPFR